MPNTAATAPDTPDTAPADESARLRAEENLAMLDDLKRAALRVALSLERQITRHDPAAVAEAVPAEPTAPADAAPMPDDADSTDSADPAPDPIPARSLAELALAFHRAGRAVRLTVALQDRLLAEAARGSVAGSAAAAGAKPPATSVKVLFVDGVSGALHDNAMDVRPWSPPSAQARAVAQENRAEALGAVRRMARATLLPGELSPRDEAEVIERLCREAAECLEAEGETEHEFEDVLRRPVSEVVAHICREIGLRPDWPTLAKEAWALRELAGERVGEPLARFSSPASGGGGPPSGGGGAGPPDPHSSAHPGESRDPGFFYSPGPSASEPFDKTPGSRLSSG